MAVVWKKRRMSNCTFWHSSSVAASYFAAVALSTGSQEYRETVCADQRQQVPILLARPTHLRHRAHVVAMQFSTQGTRHTCITPYAHARSTALWLVRARQWPVHG